MALLAHITSQSAAVILSLAVILLAGFLMTRITKKLRLPDVTGYILAGVIIGPYALHLIPDELASGMDFVTDIALAYIAFGVGKYFMLDRLKKNAKKTVVITVFESLTAAAVVTLTMVYVFHFSVSFSLLLGAIASATAPASTIMTIGQYHAKGEFVDTILQVVALDDAVALIAFSVCAAIANDFGGGGSRAVGMEVLVLPALNVAVLLLGAGCGFLMKWIINDRRTRDHKLILVNAIIFGLTGFCTMLDISPLLPCMVMGGVYVNIIENKDLFKQVNHFTPPIMLMFFVLSGMRLNVPMLKTVGIAGVCYFFVRILGKYAGAYLGARLSGSSREARRYLGLALIPQAGVSIGLAALGQRLLLPELGNMLSTIILSSSILYEIAGPACAKASLILAHSIDRQPSPENAGNKSIAAGTGRKKAPPQSTACQEGETVINNDKNGEKEGKKRPLAKRKPDKKHRDK